MEIQKKTIDSLSKHLAQAGIASRRKAADLIRSGQVTVNETVITEPGYKITRYDSIKVCGSAVATTQKVYVLLNKPKNCISTVSDELGRHNVIDLISSEVQERVYPIGRLDRNSTGLLILTNDGDLTLKLSDPRSEIEKAYHVLLNKSFSRGDMQKLVDGVELEDGLVVVDEAYFIDDQSKRGVGIALHSSKNQVVRRLFAQLGYEVEKLDRVYYAGLVKKGLKTGEWRYLTSQEVADLKNL